MIDPQTSGAVLRKRPGWRRRGRGFTLLEVLLSLALLAMVLTGFSVMIFSMAEAWRTSERPRLLARHAHAVTDHIEAMFRQSVQSATASGRQSAVTPEEIKLPSGSQELLLTFVLPEGDRLLAWPGNPLPDVSCSLANDPSDGLVLYWHSRTEIDFSEEPPRKLVLSPLGKIEGYDYFDETLQSWKKEDEMVKASSGENPQPTRIHLSFTNKAGTVETIINIPRVAEGLPAF